MNDDTAFSFQKLADLDIVPDNARSHAPFVERKRPSTVVTSDRCHTRWGGDEYVVSTIPKRPSRDSSMSPPPPSMSNRSSANTTVMPSCPFPSLPSVINSNRVERIQRIRSRWNSQTCRDDTEENWVKISSGPTRPRRSSEDVPLPMQEDCKEGKDLDLFVEPEGIAWKRTLQLRTQTPDWYPDEDTPDWYHAKEKSVNALAG